MREPFDFTYTSVHICFHCAVSLFVFMFVSIAPFDRVLLIKN